ncbi:MAG TPA: hypothetical protein VI670_19110 [Thermoanaerobaculia bacterium]|jgi:hypothetical protein
MRLTITAILLAAATAALAQQPSDDSLQQGLLNLATMQQLATAMEYQKLTQGTYRVGAADSETAGILAVDIHQLRDPWGTPYRIEVDPKFGYRIAGAGSDKTFEESTWAAKADTTSLAADCVIVAGAFVRTNRSWLAGFVSEAQKSEQSLPTAFLRGDVYREINTVSNAWAWLRINEIEAEALKKDPKFADIVRERITQDRVRALSERFLKARVVSRSVRAARIPRVLDEWGTALEVSFVDPEGQHFRIISAGADKTFNRDSWAKPITGSFEEDIVYDDNAWTRVLDLDTLAQSFLPPELQAHPSVTKQKTATGQQIYKVGGDVAAPVALVRGAVPYPPELAGARKIGAAEVTIDASGKVIEVKPMLGLSPAADRMIADALSRWEFRPATRAGQPVAVIYSVTVSLTPPN